MNKSKFLKKSLALLLAFMLVFAMIPLGAAAAEPVPPEISEVLVSANGSDWDTDVATSGKTGTVTGDIPNVSGGITLKMRVKDNRGSVSYIDMSNTGNPEAPATPNNGIWEITLSEANANYFISGDKLEMTVKVLADNVTTEYAVTLTREDMSVDTSVQELTVSRFTGSDWVPQLGNTKIDLKNYTIDITVPYDATGSNVKVTKLVLPNGAWMTKDDGNTPVEVDTSLTVGTQKVIVNNGTKHTLYTLNIKNASGFQEFSVKGALDTIIFPDENAIMVLLPYGYTKANMKKDGTAAGYNVPLAPEFELDYSNAKVTWTSAGAADKTNYPSASDSVKINSGETEVNITAPSVWDFQGDKTTNVTMSPVNYYTKLAAEKSNANTDYTWEARKEAWPTWAGFYNNFAVARAASVKIEYVEDTERTYDVYFAEPHNNTQAEITALSIGNDDATINQETKTIDITVPYGTNVAALNTEDLVLTASQKATIKVPMQGVDITASSPDARNLSDTYNTFSDTLDASKPVTISVESQDKATTVDYKLNVTVTNNYEKPKLNSLTLRAPDGVDYEGKLGSNNTWIFEVPYSYRYNDPNANWANWKVFYNKTVGAKIEGLPANGGAMTNHLAALPTVVGDKTTLGGDITATHSKGDTEKEKTIYKIRIDCKAGDKISTLKNFSLTTASKAKDVTTANTYPGSIATNGTITVKFPWADYQTITKNNTAGVQGLVYPVAEPTKDNVKYYYCTTGKTTLEQIEVLPKDATGTEYALQWFNDKTLHSTYGNSYREIYVLSEQLWVDLEKKSVDAVSGKILKAGLTGNDSLYTKYTIKAVQNDALVGHDLNSLTLIDPDTGWTTTLPASLSNGGSITGTVPYGFTSDDGKVNKLYLSYTGEKGIHVLGADSQDTLDKASNSTTIQDGSIKRGVQLDTNKVPTSEIGRFTNYADGKAVNAITTEANRGAYLTISRDGKTVKFYDGSNTPDEVMDNFLRVANEDGKSGIRDYKFNLTVAEPNTDSSFLSFSLNNYAGVIGKDAQGRDIITVNVPFLTDVTYLTPNFTLSQGAVVKLDKSTEKDGENLLSGTRPLNFSTPRQFTVVSEGERDSTTYTVTVKVADQFVDVPESAWYYKEVMEAVSYGLITGKGEGYFKPLDPVTRGDFALLIARMENGGEEGWKEAKANYTEAKFPDVSSNDYYFEAVNYCAEKGYIDGNSDGTFNAKRTIRREEMAKLMCNVAKLSQVTSPATKFADDASISDWAKGYVYAVTEKGLVNGVGNNKFSPKGVANRCQAAAILVRYTKSK